MTEAGTQTRLEPTKRARDKNLTARYPVREEDSAERSSTLANLSDEVVKQLLSTRLDTNDIVEGGVEVS